MLHEWREYNFPRADALQQLMGVVEEIGELHHVELKRLQGIRGYDDDAKFEHEARDAVGDILIFLAGYCSYRKWDIVDIYRDTIEEVVGRDWIKNKMTGLPLDASM